MPGTDVCGLQPSVQIAVAAQHVWHGHIGQSMPNLSCFHQRQPCSTNANDKRTTLRWTCSDTEALATAILYHGDVLPRHQCPSGTDTELDDLRQCSPGLSPFLFPYSTSVPPSEPAVRILSCRHSTDDEALSRQSEWEPHPVKWRRHVEHHSSFQELITSH